MPGLLRSSFREIVFSPLALMVSIQMLSADDWPTFRGADRTGVAPDTGLLEHWPKEGPPLIWKTAGAGRGYSSIAIKNGRMFTLGDAPSIVSDKDEYLVSFQEKDGQPVWKTRVGAPWTQGKPDWQSSRGTPSVNDEYVYAISPQGELICCLAADGKEIWRKHLVHDFGGKKGDGWGYSESPLLDGNRVICTPGGEKATVVALNGQTGELIWKTVRADDRGAGHASMVISEIGGVKVYVQTTAGGALGVRANDGKLLWSYPIDATTAVAPTPIIRDDYVFFSAGYRRGGALLQQLPGPDGTVTIKEIYPLKVKLANKHGGIVLVGDFLYGDSDDSGTPFCADFLTGEVKWQARGSGKGSACIAAADGHIYLRYANGVTVLAKADPEKYEEVGAFEPPGSGERPSWSHPVILDGKLYLRDQDVLTCFDLRTP
ncbi:MAG: PQQ-binding-like beta-propeller repeat protein [Planctomycetaceae bacterium]